MAASPNPSPRTPDFPYWPFNCLSLYSQIARDVGNCTQAVSKSTDAMEAARAEADLGVKLFADLMQGYFELALAPWTAMASVMAARAEEAQPAPDAQVRPFKSRARTH
jgi:hypothetical protein